MSVFACSDLHGMMESYNQIKAFIKPGDKVYCLGDCGDRGPEPWQLIKTIAADEQFEYIKGNHEDMLVSAMYEYNDGYMDFFTQQLISNGGGETLLQWAGEGGNMQWAHYLDRLPLSAEYINKDGIHIFMCHAGCTPCFWWDQNESEHKISFGSPHWWLWDRDHFHDEIKVNNVIVVHGHTPAPILAQEILKIPVEIGALWYANDHKVDIDYGTFDTGICILLDLDTFDEHIFMTDDCKI